MINEIASVDLAITNIIESNKDNELPKVSVVTVVYNDVSSIEATIKSVIIQSCLNLEYIVIDGGSTDGTVDVIKKYSDSISYWISERDMGIYDAMNKGSKQAKGTWILNINAGDELLTIPYDELRIAQENNYDALCGCVLTDNNIITKPKYNWRIKLYNTLPHQGLFYKKDSLYSNYNLKYKIFSDFAYNIGMYNRKQTVFLTDKIISFHSLGGISNHSSSTNELLSVVYDMGDIFTFSVSYLRFKWKGLISRFKK